MNKDEIKQLLEPHNGDHLECDGATRVFAWLLKEAGIDHTIKIGTLEFDGEAILPHCWIELADGQIIDYKARMWLPDAEGVPHGVFNLSEYPKALYVGEEPQGFLVSQTMFNILTRTATL